MRLYNYNRLPASPRWRELLPDEAAVERHLGINNGPQLLRNWRRLDSDKAPWLAWQSTRAALKSNRSGSTYKLYISPGCNALRDAFQVVTAVANKSAAHHFKVGNSVFGLLRPDKMVLYFHHFTDLQETADEIMGKLKNSPVHGVPFTAELAGDGLLSWGIDPPAERTVPWLERESWRLRITNQLATALLLAKSSGATELSPWRFAIDRLRLEGVETQTWTPSRTLAWAESGAGEFYGVN
jgi:hypothetical protein